MPKREGLGRAAGYGGSSCRGVDSPSWEAAASDSRREPLWAAGSLKHSPTGMTVDIRKLLVTVVVVWLVVSAAFIVLSFFGESGESGTALSLL